ncbi:MAG TPA: DUF5670 family protein [Chthoniobacterales bacterium]|jgi:hypothetical protein
MLYTVGTLLLVLWLFAWLALHLLGAAVHILLLLAIVCLVLAFVRRA